MVCKLPPLNKIKNYGKEKKIWLIDLANPKSGAPGLFILTVCTVSENKGFWNCPRFGVSRYC